MVNNSQHSGDEDQNKLNAQNEKRRVPEGTSVFDLIMPWKAEVVT